MPDNPYRPAPEPPTVSDELAHLAEKGEHRLAAKTRKSQAAAERAEQDGDLYLRQALGAYHGTPVRKLAVALLALAVLGLVGGFWAWGRLGMSAFVAGIVVFALGIVGCLFAASMKALATPKTVAAEKQWIAALPFGIDHYFDVLGSEPVQYAALVVELEWAATAQGQPPEPAVVHGIAGLWDADARVTPQPGGGVQIRSGKLASGYWDQGAVVTAESFGRISPNGKLVAAVHRLVDQVLLPLHRNHAIARISIARVEEQGSS